MCKYSLLGHLTFPWWKIFPFLHKLEAIWSILQKFSIWIDQCLDFSRNPHSFEQRILFLTTTPFSIEFQSKWTHYKVLHSKKIDFRSLKLKRDPPHWMNIEHRAFFKIYLIVKNPHICLYWNVQPIMHFFFKKKNLFAINTESSSVHSLNN